MNPLDLRGPDFLAFYIPYAVVVFAMALAVRWVYKGSLGEEPVLARWTPGVYPRDGDAYAIALLRGGPAEVARTVLGRLVACNLIEVSGPILRRTTPPGTWPSLDPLETQALQVFDNAIVAARAEQEVRKAVALHLQLMANDLKRQGLIPKSGQRRGYWQICGLALAAVSGLGVAKLLVALLRGRGNVGYLALLLILFTALGYYLLKPPLRTRFGDRYLDWLKESHRGLINLLSSGRRDDLGEMALIAGIYGLGILPAFGPLHTALKQPPPDPYRGGGDAGGGGGSCGGGASSCGGGGCGGGGCGGGGCGGCGG
ncbi:MAG: TIGR04222 domain-containing membrane protein [Acidobacteriota bacterium]